VARFWAVAGPIPSGGFQRVKAATTDNNRWTVFVDPVATQRSLIVDHDVSDHVSGYVEGSTTSQPYTGYITQVTLWGIGPDPPAGAPPDASLGISVHGYDASGNDYSAFEWVDNNNTRQVFPVSPGGTTWQSKCMP
jgi:hypothetical protein